MRGVGGGGARDGEDMKSERERSVQKHANCSDIFFLHTIDFPLTCACTSSAVDAKLESCSSVVVVSS